MRKDAAKSVWKEREAVFVFSLSPPVCKAKKEKKTKKKIKREKEIVW